LKNPEKIPEKSWTHFHEYQKNPTGIQEIFSYTRKESWKNPEIILKESWKNPGRIQEESIKNPGYILTESWKNPRIFPTYRKNPGRIPQGTWTLP